ncbi:MAG: MBL fold metallo-hydrolase [Sulfurimicrobium sp.]|nr:MBL fold metallo-hydrolase [Sulfurimicrobium sp.]MDP1706200.1 MBL fold metallo-hydrolase [Sulfurimicrobium sp.]MDZ7656117.1 MBL fold metallo-hydrolase [Sulfurimicrobium sp.]
MVKINERIYALLGPMGQPNAHNQGYMVNSTVIIGEQGVILIDSGASDEVGKHIGKAIAKLTTKPVTHVINTHHHGDHVLGNVVFGQAEIISSEICRDMVNKTGDEWVALIENLVGHKLPYTRPVPASVTYAGENSRTERTIQGVKMVFWIPTGSHTVGDMMVYLPDDKVLVGGDILVNRTIPVMRDALVKNWVGTLEQVLAFDAKTIVPGHGPLMKLEDVNKLQRQMAAFYSGIEAGYKKGLSDSETRKTLDVREWKKLEGFDANIGGNVSRTYLEIEQASF